MQITITDTVMRDVAKQYPEAKKALKALFPAAFPIQPTVPLLADGSIEIFPANHPMHTHIQIDDSTLVGKRNGLFLSLSKYKYELLPPVSGVYQVLRVILKDE